MNNKSKKRFLSILVFSVFLIIFIIFVLKFFMVNSEEDTNIESEEDYAYSHLEEIFNINFANKVLNIKNETPIILFTSDYQGDDRVGNAYELFEKTREYVRPDLFVVCGDYQVNSPEKFGNSELGILELSGIFSECFDKSIPQIYVQGNHDSLEANGLAEDGIYESDKYIIYVINRNSFPNNQTEEPDQEQTVIETAKRLKSDLQYLLEKDIKKPIFISTHVPLHYTSRNKGNDNAYASYIVDVLNEYGKKLNLIYLFGHNHSGTFDDYIGGTINYIGKGETMQVGGNNVSTNINFTYLNAGYIGFSNNSVTDHSTREMSVTAIKIQDNDFEIQKYTKYGEYYAEPITVELLK